MLFRRIFCAAGAGCAFTVATTAQLPPPFDVLIKGGTVYDGSGAEGRTADLAIRGDRIVGVGDLPQASAKNTIDAHGLAVAPGFINMLSWSNESLIQDGRSQSEIRQGVTTEIMGEGESMGPLNSRMKERLLREQKDIKFDIKWNTLAEYLKYLEQRGVSQNFASFIGAGTVRENVIGLADVAPTPEHLEKGIEKIRKAVAGIAAEAFEPQAGYHCRWCAYEKICPANRKER